MLIESGDLIPVLSEAVEIPWTKRKNQIMGFLHRGNVDFRTLVYDSNVGDISPLATYFNPRKWSVEDLNERFGQVCYDDTRSEISGYTSIPGSEVKSSTLTPRLILYPSVQQSRQKDDSLCKKFINFPPVGIWKIPPLIATPKGVSKLPSPPNISPETCSSGEESFEPIGPPKRRRLSEAGDYHSSLSVPIKSFKKRPASTSSTWTPNLNIDTLSPFISLQPPEVFADESSADEEEPKGGVRDEQTLVRSLRKIAKAYESGDW